MYYTTDCGIALTSARFCARARAVVSLLVYAKCIWLDEIVVYYFIVMYLPNFAFFIFNSFNYSVMLSSVFLGAMRFRPFRESPYTLSFCECAVVV